mgnify:CR=1 FL=1
MACCNNECLEPLYAECIQVDSSGFQNLSTESETLTEVLTNIDNVIYNAEYDLSNTNVTVNLQGLAGDCSTTLSASLTYTNGATTDSIAIAIPGVTTGTIIFPVYSASVSVYSGANLVASSVDLSISIPFAASSNNGNALTVIINLNVLGGAGPYHATVNVPSYSPNVTMVTELECNANSTVTLPIISLFNLLINKINDLQNQINVLNG